MISEEIFEKRLSKIQKLNDSAERRRKLINSIDYLPKLKLPPTSKIVLWAVILYCIHLTSFFEKTIDKMLIYASDYISIGNVLISFIGILATIITTVIGYYIKSTKENTAGGIIYESAMRDSEEESEACG